MKKALLFIVPLIVLSGCDYYTNSMAISKQDYSCRNNGGVYSYGSFYDKLECMDGSLIGENIFMSATLPPEYYPKKER